MSDCAPDSPEVPATPEPTIVIEDCFTARCGHCQADTVQVVGGTGQSTPTGQETSACLQCIADGGNCCSLAPLNRHV